MFLSSLEQLSLPRIGGYRQTDGFFANNDTVRFAHINMAVQYPPYEYAIFGSMINDVSMLLVIRWTAENIVKVQQSQNLFRLTWSRCLLPIDAPQGKYDHYHHGQESNDQQLRVIVVLMIDNGLGLIAWINHLRLARIMVTVVVVCILRQSLTWLRGYALHHRNSNGWARGSFPRWSILIVT